MGVGDYAPQLHIAHAGLVQRVLHPVQNAGALDAAVVDEDFFAAKGLDLLAHLVQSPLAKDHLGGGIVLEIHHGYPLLSKSIYCNLPKYQPVAPSFLQRFPRLVRRTTESLSPALTGRR